MEKRFLKPNYNMVGVVSVIKPTLEPIKNLLSNQLSQKRVDADPVKISCFYKLMKIPLLE
jgi:hypothetical protein